MKTRTFLAGAAALAFATGTVLMPCVADAAQTFHGGGGHGGGGYGGGGYGGADLAAVMGAAIASGEPITVAATATAAVITAAVMAAGATATAAVTAVITPGAADRCRWFSGSAAHTATETSASFDTRAAGAIDVSPAPRRAITSAPTDDETSQLSRHNS